MASRAIAQHLNLRHTRGKRISSASTRCCQSRTASSESRRDALRDLVFIELSLCQLLPSAHFETLKTIGFIGAGKMAQALAGGIQKDFPDLAFVVSDPSAEALAAFEQSVSGRSCKQCSNQEVFEQSGLYHAGSQTSACGSGDGIYRSGW